MNTFIALLRGINVGGHHKLPMRDLVQLLESLNLANINTYIQSGNVVFQTPRLDRAALGAEIGAAIERGHGFRPQVMLLGLEDLAAAISQNPYPHATREPKSLHFYFLETTPPAPDMAKLAAARTDREQFALVDQVFYLHAPDGIGRSRLAGKVEQALGVATTARNWRTVSKLMEMGTALTT